MTKLIKYLLEIKKKKSDDMNIYIQLLKCNSIQLNQVEKKVVRSTQRSKIFYTYI